MSELPAVRSLSTPPVVTLGGEERGTVLDAAFDPVTARTEAVLTTLGELPAERLLGLGGHALVVRGRRTVRDQGRSDRSLP